MQPLLTRSLGLLSGAAKQRRYLASVTILVIFILMNEKDWQDSAEPALGVQALVLVAVALLLALALMGIAVYRAFFG